jgi:hypothetical protein
MLKAWTFVSAAGRIAIGAGMMLAPARSLEALGFQRPNRSTITVGRIAGVRDIVLGLHLAEASRDPDRLRRAHLFCAAADAGDSAAFAALLDSREMRLTAYKGLAAAAPATVLGVIAALSTHRFKS